MNLTPENVPIGICCICDTAIDMDGEELKFYMDSGLAHPFIVCKECAIMEVHALPEEYQKCVINILGMESREILLARIHAHYK